MWDIGQYVYHNCLLIVVTSSEIYLSNQTGVFYVTKSQYKNLNILRKTRAFKRKSNALFIIFKGLHWSKWKNFLEGENPTLNMIGLGITILMVDQIIRLLLFGCFILIVLIKFIFTRKIMHAFFSSTEKRSVLLGS